MLFPNKIIDISTSKFYIQVAVPIPKRLFGCETSPINEGAMQKLRSIIANVLTYVTSKRSIDFTFTVASGKTDLDPDVEVYVRRVALFRRVVGDSDENKRLFVRNSRVEKIVHSPALFGLLNVTKKVHF